MIGRGTFVIAALCVLGGPAHAAADCKEIFVGRARSTADGSEQERQRLAMDDAIAHWRKQVRLTYGFDYRYWRAARNKMVQCSGGGGARSCAVKARPCRLTS